MMRLSTSLILEEEVRMPRRMSRSSLLALSLISSSETMHCSIFSSRYLLPLSRLK